MRRLLMPAFYFPPFAGVNGLRALKFAKYLPRAGWEPVVFTVSPRYYGERVVPALPRETAGMEIARIPYVPVPGARFFIKILYSLLLVAFAVRNRRLLDAVCLGGGPFYPFLTVPVLARRLGLPTVLDFRDSWSPGTPRRESGPRWLTAVLRPIRRFVERTGIRHASAVAFATTTLEKEYEEAHPASRRKFHTIPNGYDPEDFEGVEPRRAGPERTLVMAGKFLFYTPDVGGWLMDEMRTNRELRLLYVGPEAARIEALAEDRGVSARTTVHPFLSREELVPWIAGADFGLVTTFAPNGLGTKIFDYLALGKPTLCFVPPASMVARVFGSSRAVVLREAPHSRESVAEGLRMLFALPPVCECPELAGFDRRAGAARLGRILDAVTIGKRGAPPPPREEIHSRPGDRSIR